MKKLICKLFGHSYLYNFKTLPDKCICSRCKTKWYVPRYTINDSWCKIDKFTFTKGVEKTDEELIKQWVK